MRALAFIAAIAAVQTLTQKIDVSIVNVDVVVAAKDGTPVRGLTRDDFQVFEDGVSQPITNFYAVESGAPAHALRAAEGSSPAGPAAPALSAAEGSTPPLAVAGLGAGTGTGDGAGPAGVDPSRPLRAGAGAPASPWAGRPRMYLLIGQWSRRGEYCSQIIRISIIVIAKLFEM